MSISASRSAMAEDDGGSLRQTGTDLLRQEEPALRRVIERYVRDASTVDDVFQEVSIKMLKRIHTVRDPAAMRGWLFQIARNASLDHLRREARKPGMTDIDTVQQRAGGDLGRNPTDQFLSQERIDAVYKALADLPPSQREVIELRLREGLDHEAISERLGISRQAVEVRLCRGRGALKQRLQDILGGNL
ncbi:MAG: RNA polymerase sigma factor [Planctomycetota bacterium]